MSEKVDDIEVKIVDSKEDFENMQFVRRKVFVEECGIPEAKEFDGNDYSATHFIAYRNENGTKSPIGTMRVRYYARFVKTERMAVLKKYRKSDVSDKIMKKCIDFSNHKGYCDFYGLCIDKLLPRWKSCGFEPIKGAPSVMQNGMRLVPICMHIPEHPNTLTMTTHPDILNAQEGKWDEAAARLAEREAKEIPTLLLRITNKMKRNKQ